MHALAVKVIPTLTIALATLFAVLPWGLPVEHHAMLRHVMPLLPFAAIHYWILRRPDATPTVVAFVSGLIIDVVTRGPLGLWPLVFVAGIAITSRAAPVIDRHRSIRFAAFAATILILMIVQWLIASAYYVRWLELRPMLEAAMIAAVAYPIVAAMLSALGGMPRRPSNPSLSRGA
jgi:rod shape-determining protein MreD